MITLRSDKIHGRISQFTSCGRFLNGFVAAEILDNALYALSWGVERFLPKEGEETIEIILPLKKGYRKRPIKVSFETLVRVAVFEGMWHRHPDGFWNPKHGFYRRNEDILFEVLNWPDIPDGWTPIATFREGRCPSKDLEIWMKYINLLPLQYKRRSRRVKTAQY